MFVFLPVEYPTELDAGTPAVNYCVDSYAESVRAGHVIDRRHNSLCVCLCFVLVLTIETEQGQSVDEALVWRQK